MLHLHGIKSQPEWRPAHSVGFPHCCGIQSSQLRQGEGFPGGTSGKEPTRLRHKKCGFDFWVGRSPGGHGNPLQYFFSWRIPWTEESSGLQSMGVRVRHDQNHLAGKALRQYFCRESL